MLLALALGASMTAKGNAAEGPASSQQSQSTSGGLAMRVIKSLLVAPIVATSSLAAAGAAHADQLSSVSFLGKTGSDVFFTEGTNVRVSYRCTSRIRIGLIQILNQDNGFVRRTSTRCDGVPRSVLLRTSPGKERRLHAPGDGGVRAVCRIRSALPDCRLFRLSAASVAPTPPHAEHDDRHAAPPRRSCRVLPHDHQLSLKDR
jgi:hypothetical protein